MKPKVVLDIVMNSSLDKNAGGRETWLHNFLPILLKDPTFEKVHLFAARTYKQTNFSSEIESLDTFIGNKKRLFATIFEVPPSRFPQAYQMYKLFKKYKDQSHISAHYVLGVGVFEMIMILRLKRYKGAKKVVWLRSIFSHEKAYAIPRRLRGLFLAYEIKKLKKVDVVLGNGDDIKEFYEPYGINVTVIKNGVDMDKWKLPALKITLPIHIAYIGRLSKVKGVEDYLRLIETVKSGPNSNHFVFHIVGDNGVYKNQVDLLTKKNYVVNHNIIPNNALPKFLSTIHVCVALTFASEDGGGGGTSNAMMEQMAAGRILLAWNNRIFEQYLTNENAYLATQHSVSDLQNQLIQILEYPREAEQKALKAIETIHPYSYDRNVANFQKALGIK